MRSSARAAVLAAALLAGCGSSSSTENDVGSNTPAQILAAARTAGAGAATVHIAGLILGPGKPISLNMDLVADKGGQGRVELDGFAIELVGLNRSVYIKGSYAFYSRFIGPGSASLLHGKWLKGSATRGALAPLAELTNLSELIDGTLADHGALSHAPTARIGGRPAVGVGDRAVGGILYVSSSGTPYPMEILEDGGRAGKLVFDNWNQPVALTAPADAVNINQLRSAR